MAETKYGHLVKQLKYENVTETEKSSGRPEYMTMPRGADLEGLNVGFAWGYRNSLGVWGADGGVGHAHPYGEVLMFSGLNYNNPKEFGAEVEITMGENGEKHVIDSPTFVILPAGFQHCPLVTKKADKPFGFLAISLSGDHKMTQSEVKDKTSPGDEKYGHLIKKFELRDLKRTSGGNADFFSAWSGKDMDGFNLNFTWAYHSGTGPFHTHDPHVHPNDECLVFVGLDPDNPDYLGAEMEIAMGEEQEIHVFDKPTVVIAPKGLVHCPLIVRKVDKPYAFTAICLSTAHDTTWLGGDPNEPNKFSGPMKMSDMA
jgi:hypothetical protein